MPGESFHVLIATCGRCGLLGRTLASLAACAKPASYQGTLVIENGPPGGASEVVNATDPSLGCRYMHVMEANKSAALNAALHDLRRGFVFMTDDDVRFAPGILEEYIVASRLHPVGRFFGGPFEAEYEQRPPEWLRQYMPISARGWSMSLANPRPTFLGFNWAARVEDLLSVGGFDTNFGPGSPLGCTGQETEMQVRLKAAGLLPVYVCGARVWHYVPLERSMPDWAIARARRNGLQVAMQSDPVGPTFVDLPLWVWRRRITSTLRAIICSLPVGPRRKLHAKACLSYNRGLIEGFRHRSRAPGGTLVSE